MGCVNSIDSLECLVLLRSTLVPPLHAVGIEERLRNLGRSRNRIANLTRKKGKCNKQTRKLRSERNKFLDSVNELLSEFNEVVGTDGKILV